MTPSSPHGTRAFLSSALGEAALTFALADHRWRTLSAERERWTDPEKQRALAAAFLRRHAAKLALESTNLPG